MVVFSVPAHTHGRVWMAHDSRSLRAVDVLKALRDVPYCIPRTQQPGRTGTASNSEIHRWVRDGAVVLNGERISLTTEWPTHVKSLVFFPSGKQRITVY